MVHLPARELTGWQRYAVVTVGALLAGLLGSLAIPLLQSARGATAPGVLAAESPVSAAVVVLLVTAAVTIVGGAVGRLVNAAVGVFVLGTGLGVIAIRSGSIETLAFGSGRLGAVALETALWGFVVAGATFAVWRIAGTPSDIVLDPKQNPSWDRLGLRGLAAALLVLPVVWLVARSPMKGQTLAATTIAGLVVGLAGRLLAPNVQPRLLVALPCFLGAAGQLLAAMLADEPLSEAYVHQSIPALGFPMPVDYAAGSLLGVSMGLGWARSFLHHEPDEP